jgi:hypothetical protein
MSESLIFSLIQLGITIAGFIALAAVANYRIGNLERQRLEDRVDRKEKCDEDKADRERAFLTLAEALAKIDANIHVKTEDAAREHAEFRAGITANGVRMDDQAERMNDHGRRLDDHGHRITKLEVRA